MPSTKPFLSIILSVGSKSHELLKSLEHVHGLTVDEYEVIVVQNGQSCWTEDDFSDEHINDLHLRLVPNTNLGGASALNQAVQSSAGKWIAIFQDESNFRPKDLERFLDNAHKCPEYELFCSNHWLNANAGLDQEESGFTKFYPESPFPVLELFQGKAAALTSMVIKRELLDEIGLFDETLVQAYEYDMLLRLFSSRRYKSCLLYTSPSPRD